MDMYLFTIIPIDINGLSTPPAFFWRHHLGPIKVVNHPSGHLRLTHPRKSRNHPWIIHESMICQLEIWLNGRSQNLAKLTFRWTTLRLFPCARVFNTPDIMAGDELHTCLEFIRPFHLWFDGWFSGFHHVPLRAAPSADGSTRWSDPHLGSRSRPNGGFALENHPMAIPSGNDWQNYGKIHHLSWENPL